MRRVSLAILFTVLAVSCQKKSSHEGAPPAASVGDLLNTPLVLDKAIVGKPPSLVSVLAPIDLHFNQPVIPPHRAGTSLDKPPFRFKPDIDGTAKWMSQTHIRFAPLKPLTPGVSYEATFLGKEAFGSQRNVDDFSFSFKTAEQEVMDLAGDFEPDTAGQNMVRFRGVISFAQPVDAGTVAHDLRFAVKGRSVDIAVQPVPENPAELAIMSEPIKRGPAGQMATFTLPKSYSVGDGKWSRELLLPEVNVFKVLAHMDMSDPQARQNSYGFRFSDPIKTGADLSGYVSIEPDIRFTVSVDKKYLKLQGPFLIGQEYTVTIAKGLPSSFGTKLTDNYTQSISLTNLKPEVQWLSEGTLLPSDNNFRLQFKSVNVARVRCSVTEIFDNNLGFFIQTNMLGGGRSGRRSASYDEEGEYYGGYESYEYNDLNRVGKQIYDNVLSIGAERNRWVKSELDLSRLFKGKRNTGFIVMLHFDMGDLCGRPVSDRNDIKDGDLFYEGDNYYSAPTQSGYYYRNGKKSKLLIASDIGLTLKTDSYGLHVYAVNVINAKPAGGLSLGLYSYQNQLIESRGTDGDGHALFSRSADGYYLRGENSSGLAVMRLDHAPWELSSFEIDGVDEGSGGINVFMYADRGVHRPGDTVHLSAILRDNRKAPPADQPVSLKVLNPKNQPVFEATQKCGANGHVYFAVPTGMSDPTGAWQAELQVGGQTFTKELKIETVKPNRLKVDIGVPDTLAPGTVSISGSVTSRYLFGTPASGLQAKMRVDLWPMPLTLAAWSEYTFGHPYRSFDRRDDDVFDKSLDDKGACTFAYAASDAAKAPELVQAILRAEVYEKGGGSTVNSKRVTIAPYRTFVGMANPFAYGGAQLGQSYQLPLIVTDIHGKPVAGHKLTVTWYVNRGYWWWDYDSRSRPDFRTLTATYKIAEFTLVSGDKPVRQKLDVEDYGQNFIEVTDAQSGHTCGMFFYASEWAAGPAQERKERAFLPITSDKNVYYTGDKMQLSCETPQNGVLLFTIEQGARILRQEVRAVTPGRTVLSVDVTDDMVPNCYAVVSLIQPHSQTANDAPMRIYGVKPLAVEDFSTRLRVSMEAPEEIKPNQPFSVSVSSTAPQSATYTIAIVDEGLLDLTGFDTPDPWKFYFRKLRLGVTTRDNLEEILGILFPDMDRHFSIGGDMEQQRKRAGESKVQRFKPVVLFARPITIKPGQTISTAFTMPNYVGSVRIMLVGTSQNSYASIEKTVPVRQPLMVLTTVPRVARPGDRFAVPVSAFAADASVKSADLAISASGPLEVVGNATASLAFGGPGEKDATFNLAVRQQIGAGRIIVTAQSGEHRAADTVNLPVTCPNPYYIKATDTMVTKAGSVTLTPAKFGVEGTNAARLSFTRFPDIQLNKRFRDLIHYPYGCIEQTTSSAFPQLYLGALLDLSAVDKQMITDNVNAAIDRLSHFSMSGGFSYWPLNSYHTGEVSDWGTSYAGHFLIEARAAGYHVPDELFNHWLTCTQGSAKTVDSRNHRYQCYRLFLLALAGSPHQGAMNLVRENYLSELDPLSRKMLAASFFLSGQKDAARQIDRTAITEIATFREMSGTFGSTLRDQAMVAYLAYTMGDLSTAASVLKTVAKSFTPYGWYSTQETAMAMLAISAVYAKSPMTGGAIAITASVKGEKAQKLLLKGYQTGMDATALWGKEITISTETDNPLFVTLFEEGIPLQDVIRTEQKGIELTRTFYDDDGQPITLQSISQGNQFWIRYRVRSQTHEPLQQLALSSLLPSGWEIVNQRLEGTTPPQWVINTGATDGTYMDLRDDRVNWFFDLSDDGTANFLVKCSPTFKGSYRLPPVTVEPMYSPDYFARIGGEEVSVK